MSGPAEEIRSEIAALLPRLWRHARVLCFNADQASDLVQMTCLRALERSHQFTIGTQLDRWLFTILRSIWLNELRAQRVRLGHGSVEATSLRVDGVTAANTNILARQVLNEVEALPDGQREAVFLVYVEGLSYKEAAAFLDVPIGTVMSRLAAARLRLGPLKEEEPMSANASRLKP